MVVYGGGPDGVGVGWGGQLASHRGVNDMEFCATNRPTMWYATIAWAQECVHSTGVFFFLLCVRWYGVSHLCVYNLNPTLPSSFAS